MIIELAAGSSTLARATAALVLATHITAGGVGLASGAVALVARKGSPLHRRAGTWFFGSMLTMAGVGAGAAVFLPQRPSIVVGLFTGYLVVTARAAVTRPPNRVGAFEAGALLTSLGIVAAFAVLGWLALNDPKGQLDGLPAAPSFVFGAVAALAAIGDFRRIARRDVSAAARIARHLWRMCFALLIAAASFFLGQPQVFPPSLRGSFLLFLPEIAILAMMIFWLYRTRFAKRVPPTRA